MEEFKWAQSLGWSVTRTFFAIADTYTAICELIDNSLAANAKEIRIELDLDNNCLTFTDCKGYGMNEDELKRDLLHWGREKPEGVLRFFGGGGKGAWGYIGTNIKVFSTPRSMEATYILHLPNFQERTINGDTTVGVDKVVPALFNVPTVRIEMGKLKVKIDLFMLQKRIASTYASALRQGIKIVLKRTREKKLLSRTVKPLELPMETSRRVERKTGDGRGTVKGELGLKTKEGVAGGIRCSQGTIGRLICRETFGFEEERDINFDKIIGWVDNDFVPFTMNKDSFQKGAKEYEEFYNIMREELDEVVNLVRSEVLLPMDVERAMPEIEKQINKIMQDLDWPLSAHGQEKPLTKKLSEILVMLTEKKIRKGGELIHQKQPKDTDRGIRQRKGGIKLDLEANADESIRSRHGIIGETGIYHIWVNSEFPGLKASYYEGKRTKATDNWVLESAAMEVATEIAESPADFKRLVNEVMARVGS